MSIYDPAMQEAIKIASTPQGQQLIKLLTQLGGNDLQNCIQQAAAGNMAQAKKALSALLENEDARKLLEEIGGSYGKS